MFLKQGGKNDAGVRHYFADSIIVITKMNKRLSKDNINAILAIEKVGSSFVNRPTL
jgi:hypothetical protein